jgi:hypothetical protein
MHLHLRSPWVLAAGGAAATALVLGVPSDVIPNPWFERKLPTQSFELVVLVALTAIAAAIAATYASPAAPSGGLGRTGTSAGVVGWFAVTCPVCNPIVVALLGTSGAASTFSRWQPVFGAVAVALGMAALTLRLRAARRGTCAVPIPRRST